MKPSAMLAIAALMIAPARAAEVHQPHAANCLLAFERIGTPEGAAEKVRMERVARVVDGLLDTPATVGPSTETASLLPDCRERLARTELGIEQMRQTVEQAFADVVLQLCTLRGSSRIVDEVMPAKMRIVTENCGKWRP